MRKLRSLIAIALCVMMMIPMSVSAAVTKPGDGTMADYTDLQKAAYEEIYYYYTSNASRIPADKVSAVETIVNGAKDSIKGYTTSAGTLNRIVENTIKDMEALMTPVEPNEPENPDQPSEPDKPEDTTPTSTDSNIMVGGTWVTPTAVYGQHVNVVLPVVNMGKGNASDAVVTPVIGTDVSTWPFEIEKSSYTQTINDLPGTDTGVSDMDRRRELTWTLKTRKDAVTGYQKLTFNVTYHDETDAVKTATLETYIYVKGSTGMSKDGKPSTPRVIVTGFSTNPETVNAGDTFTLTLHLKNTSKSTNVTNMLIDMQSAVEGDKETASIAFLPVAGSSTVFVESLPSGSSKDISIDLKAKADLSQKPYVLDVKMEYEDEAVNAYSDTASVSIPIKQEARVDVSTPEVMPSSIDVGSESNIMFSIYNTGKTKLYNTSVKMEADSISGGEAFVGNIEPGATGNVDMYVMGQAVTADEGKVKINITFEDEAGNPTTIEKEIELFVNEPMMDMGGDMMGGMDPGMMEDAGGGFKIWYVVVPLAVIVVATGVVLILIKRKKKKALELAELEGIDEDEIS